MERKLFGLKSSGWSSFVCHAAVSVNLRTNDQLFSQTDKVHPVASFKKYHKYKDAKTGEQIENPATLTVTPAGEEILDMILVSFLLLEKERRIKEKSTVSMADSVGCPTGMMSAG